jgi:hypothetical protein
MFIFAGFAWALWTTWSKMAIERRFSAVSFMKKWSVLKEEERSVGWLKEFTPSVIVSTDVYEI